MFAISRPVVYSVGGMTRTVTTDFRDEYEAERTRWLRKRFLWYSGVVLGFSLLQLIGTYISIALGQDPLMTGQDVLLITAVGLPNVIGYLAAFLFVLRRPLRRDALLRLVFWLIVGSGVIGLVTSPIFAAMGFDSSGVTFEVEDAPAVEDLLVWAQRVSALNMVFVTHFVAALFLPWTVREAILPLIPLILVFIPVSLIVGEFNVGSVIFTLLSGALVGLPGIAICWWRNSRFRKQFHYRMLRGKYGELQRELVDARNVHEGLFPQRITTGPVRFHYCYEPMHQIGGDYLYMAKTTVDSDDTTRQLLSVVLIDVTGHGLKAALTVNRIYGELERLFGEHPDITPGQVLQSMNRYFNLTLSKHTVYATAFCLQVDVDNDQLRWANAGHPPAFVRDAAGHLDQLDSSAPLLGVFPRAAYELEEHSRSFLPGDTILAYTDGATDTINESDERLNIEGVQKILLNHPPPADHDEHPDRWCGTLLREMDRYRFGPSVDDILLVEVYRPLA